MQSLIHLIVRWKDLYSNSLAVSTTITATHLFALLVSGGLAIAGDRSTLRTLRRGGPHWEREYQLRELWHLHRPILIGLVVLVATGLLIAAADLETFAGSILFWVKMGLIVLLMLNGIALLRTERTLTDELHAGQEPSDRLWNRLRRTTWASLSLWLLTAAVGVLLTVAA